MIEDPCLPPDEPTGLAEYLWYCREYEDKIYFRVERDGEWKAVSLANLTPKEYGEHLGRLLEETLDL